jgi:hypothetical protein
MKKHLILILSVIVVTLSVNAKNGFNPYKVEVNHFNDTASKYFVRDHRIYSEGWDKLAQPHFWKTAMTLTNDSGILNIGSTREILDVLSVVEWEYKSPEYKQAYRDSVKERYCLPADEHIYFTSGKSHFYDFTDVIPSIDRAVRIFEADSTDPFFAQAILLIESPGRPKKSPVGAYGSFQLMKGVAIQMGLTVNSKVDDRKDFDLCAKGSAKLLRTVCIPETNRMLQNRNIAYSEDDLWYKLLVLHVYHAGAYNVGKALNCIPADKRVGNEIITQLWDVECGSFRNASQNYTQVALASLIELENIIMQSCESMEPLALN